MEFLRREGVRAFVHTAARRAVRDFEDTLLKYWYRWEQGPVAPRPDERYWIDPCALDYSIYSFHFPEERHYPNYGIIDGDWDLQKQPWRESPVWTSLRARFEENVPWEETRYYQNAIENIREGEPVGYLDGPQTEENLESYLRELEHMYADMMENGYDSDSVLIVHVARDGEWMVGHGNHRRTLAVVADIDAVPVKIRYRHEQWQEIRLRFHRADSMAEVADIAEYRTHPDVPDIDD